MEMEDGAGESRSGRRGPAIVLVFAALLIAGVVLFVLPIRIQPGGNAARTDQAKIAKVKGDLAALGMASRLFRTDHGRWPASLEELYQPPPDPSGKVQKYLLKLPLDPWTGQPLGMRLLPDGDPVFHSFGADGAPGGDGINADLTSEVAE